MLTDDRGAVIRFISRAEANSILEAKVAEIKATYSHLTVDEQIDIMAQYLTECDPQISRESTRQFWEEEEVA